MKLTMSTVQSVLLTLGATIEPEGLVLGNGSVGAGCTLTVSLKPVVGYAYLAARRTDDLLRLSVTEHVWGQNGITGEEYDSTTTTVKTAQCLLSEVITRFTR